MNYTDFCPIDQTKKSNDDTNMKNVGITRRKPVNDSVAVPEEEV